MFLPAVLWINTQFFKFPIDLVLYSQKIGPLQLAIHVVQNRRAGEQSRPETRQTKGIQSQRYFYSLQQGGFVPREWLAAKSLLWIMN